MAGVRVQVSGARVQVSGVADHCVSIDFVFFLCFVVIYRNRFTRHLKPETRHLSPSPYAAARSRRLRS